MAKRSLRTQQPHIDGYHFASKVSVESALEDGEEDEQLLRIFHHARNKTGIVGGKKTWSDDAKVNELWQRLSQPEGNDVAAVQRSFTRHVFTTLARTYFNIDDFASYQAAAHAVRDRLIMQWDETQLYHTKLDVKRVYYLSMEFLMGRTLTNALLNMDLKGVFSEALKELGFALEDAIQQEHDAALGNGGLGRLAACFMDSLATLNYPAWGYGLRYTYGIFQQQIHNGFQVEFPDYWLASGNPWEVERLDVCYDVKFYGTLVRSRDAAGQIKYSLKGGEIVEAVAYDVPIPGFKTRSTINIRLWSSKPVASCSFDLRSFNEGNYQKSVEQQQRAENITSVLYPNDNTMEGKELRLKQQYFFVSATLQDIIRRFKKSVRPWSEFPDQVAIQLNDTHPTLGIAELQRILVDVEHLSWDEAWNIVTRVYSFTNHTVLPEAMEKWPVALITNLLPRQMQIIYDINLFFLQAVEARFPGDRARLGRMSIIEESPYQQVRMAHLAVIGSHTVNGVAEIHSTLIKETIFTDFVEFFGAPKFQNKTNGITPRRWLHQANPRLSALISRTLAPAMANGHGNGEGLDNSWLTDLSQISAIGKEADSPAFQKEWNAIKYENKVRLAEYIREECNLIVSPEAMFDVQVKRIHEYKRQFMNILSVIHRYLTLKAISPDQLAAYASSSLALNRSAKYDGTQSQGTLPTSDAPPADVTAALVPRVIIFGGKAAPGYHIAKLVIKLITSVAEVINADAQTNNLLKIVFIPDYNVSNAEIIIPASDLSEHISTAGTEASGTSNMKFVLNGGLIIGTMDGANIEICEEVGRENMFIFGCAADKVDDIRHNQKYRKTAMDEKLAAVIDCLRGGRFGAFETFGPLIDTLVDGGDFYLISHDFASYVEAQQRADLAYLDRAAWTRMSILSASRMGKFSSDRSMREYARDIWRIDPCVIPESHQPPPAAASLPS